MKNMKKFYYIIGTILILWMVIFAFINGNCQSFWADELASIGYIRTGVSLKEMLQTYLNVDTNLPLYSLILYFVYRIAPYGEKFLLLPSILFCAGGVVVLGAAVTKLEGYLEGLIAICLGCASNALLWQGSWEIRCYGLAFFLSAVTLYAYMQKTLKPDTKNMIFYSISILLFLWTHWFASILAALYGLADLSLVIRRKISWKKLCCYLPGALTFLPWLIVSFVNKQSTLKSFWGETPGWKDMPWTVLFLLSGRRILWYLCLITGAVILWKAIYLSKKTGQEEKKKNNLAALCVMAIGWMIGIVFIYSRYISPEGSLYVQRYFMVLVPHVLLVTTYGLVFILRLGEQIKRNKGAEKEQKWKSAISYGMTGGVCLLLIIELVLCYKEAYLTIRKPFEEYREATEYLVEEGGIWDEKSLFIGSNKYCMLDGLIDYYFIRRGYEPPANIIDGGVHAKEETRFYPNYTMLTKEELLSFEKIYCIRIHMGFDEETDMLIEENYIKREGTPEGVEVWDRKDGTQTAPIVSAKITG